MKHAPDMSRGKKSDETRRPVALVTGASRGLGREIALALAGKGYRVAINYRTSEEEALEVVQKAGPECLAFRADVGEYGQVERMAAKIGREFGGLDAVISNAGITRDSLLIRQSEEDWDGIVRTNLTGCFNVIRASAPFIKRSGGGHIVTIASYSGVKGKEGQAAYSASKAALTGLSYTSAIELAKYNIRVNVLLPGYMPTDMGKKAARAMEAARERSILGRLSSPAEAAQFVLFLLGTENVTGQVFSLDSRIL